jgi:arylsulfatase A-like enzyme
MPSKVVMTNHTNSTGQLRNSGTVLQTAGYRTFWSGKHHGEETPVDIGYDRYYGLREGASNHFNPGVQREGEAKPAQKRPDRPFSLIKRNFSHIPS